MRPFLMFVLMMAVSLVAAAALTYPVWLGVGLLSVEPVHRVMHRLAMLFALIGLLLLLRRLNVGNKAALGYDMPRAQFLRQMAIGLGIGFALMIPLAASLFALDLRVLKPEVSTGTALLGTLAGGLLTGLLVAFIEETFFRGAMFSAIRRTSGTVMAVVLPSLIYASVHFLSGRLKIPPELVTWGSGFDVLARLFDMYREPARLVDSLAALFAVGVLLGVARVKTGAIALCIGMHAGFVCVIKVISSVSGRNPDAPFAWLVGNYDGVIGWLAMGWIVLFLAGYAMARRRKVDG